jgi:hypothetical protein
MDEGWVFLTLREYRQGKLSLGTMAKRLKMPLADVIDLLAELGVRSPIEFDDYLKSYASASEFVRD